MSELIEINETLQQETAAYKEEFIKNTEVIHDGAGLDVFETLDEWFASIRDNVNIAAVRQNRVLASTYFARCSDDGKWVGIIDTRHTIHDYLLNFGGHIGYSVRKSQRGNGYAKEMLGLVLQKCRAWDIQRVLITCDKDNPASARTIIRIGGILENEVIHDGIILQRYHIQL